MYQHPNFPQLPKFDLAFPSDPATAAASLSLLEKVRFDQGSFETKGINSMIRVMNEQRLTNAQDVQAFKKQAIDCIRKRRRMSTSLTSS